MKRRFPLLENGVTTSIQFLGDTHKNKSFQSVQMDERDKMYQCCSFDFGIECTIKIIKVRVGKEKKEEKAIPLKTIYISNYLIIYIIHT
jgi:hypothetical protein